MGRRKKGKVTCLILCNINTRGVLYYARINLKACLERCKETGILRVGIDLFPFTIKSIIDKWELKISNPERESIKNFKVCPECNGEGIYGSKSINPTKNSSAFTCNKCGGSGMVKI